MLTSRLHYRVRGGQDRSDPPYDATGPSILGEKEGNPQVLPALNPRYEPGSAAQR